MRNIIIANWKMNPSRYAEAKKIAGEIRKLTSRLGAEIVICPPFPFISAVNPTKKFFVGAQDVFYEKEGAFTGEVSATQLRSLGVTHVIIGHSERRKMGETSETVAKKILVTLKAKMTPVVCIGEKERHQNGDHWQAIKAQLAETLRGVSKSDIKKCIVTYEPVWAISKKSYNPMMPEDIGESAIFVRKILAEMFGPKVAHGIRIIYGGSVNSENAQAIIDTGTVSGFLVGHASLTPANFAKSAATLK